MCFMSYRNDIIKLKRHLWREENQKGEKYCDVFSLHFLILSYVHFYHLSQHNSVFKKKKRDQWILDCCTCGNARLNTRGNENREVCCANTCMIWVYWVKCKPCFFASVLHSTYTSNMKAGQVAQNFFWIISHWDLEAVKQKDDLFEIPCEWNIG